MKNTLLVFWQLLKEIVLGGIFVVAVLVSGAAILTAIFGGGYGIKIGPTIYNLPPSAFDTMMVAVILWAVFLVFYSIRLICKKYAKN